MAGSNDSTEHGASRDDLADDTPLRAPGAADPPSADREEASTAASSSDRPWYWKWVDNGPVLLVILFLVTGALGLPLLYQSRAFSTRTKWIIAIINIIYTVASCYAVYLQLMHVWSLYSELLNS